MAAAEATAPEEAATPPSTIDLNTTVSLSGGTSIPLFGLGPVVILQRIFLD